MALGGSEGVQGVIYSSDSTSSLFSICWRRHTKLTIRWSSGRVESLGWIWIDNLAATFHWVRSPNGSSGNRLTAMPSIYRLHRCSRELSLLGCLRPWSVCFSCPSFLHLFYHMRFFFLILCEHLYIMYWLGGIDVFAFTALSGGLKNHVFLFFCFI